MPLFTIECNFSMYSSSFSSNERWISRKYFADSSSVTTRLSPRSYNSPRSLSTALPAYSLTTETISFARAISPRSKLREASAHNTRKTLSALVFSALESTFSIKERSGKTRNPFFSRSGRSCAFDCANSLPVRALPLRGELSKISSKRSSASAN